MQTHELLPSILVIYSPHVGFSPESFLLFVAATPHLKGEIKNIKNVVCNVLSASGFKMIRIHLMHLCLSATKHSIQVLYSSSYYYL